MKRRYGRPAFRATWDMLDCLERRLKTVAQLASESGVCRRTMDTALSRLRQQRAGACPGDDSDYRPPVIAPADPTELRWAVLTANGDLVGATAMMGHAEILASAVKGSQVLPCREWPGGGIEIEEAD